MAVSVIATQVAAGWAGPFARASGRTMPRSTVEEMRTFAVPLIPVAFLNWTTSLSDRYIIEWLTHDSAGIGIYAAGYGLTSAPMMIVNGVVLMVLRPIYFSAKTTGDEAKAERLFRGGCSQPPPSVCWWRSSYHLPVNFLSALCWALSIKAPSR